MKMTSIMRWSACVLSALALSAAANQTPASSAMKEKQATGKVERVNTDERTVTISSFLRHRTFDLGSDCTITLWNNADGSINDLRPGQKVTIGYQKSHGVLAADHVTQEAMRLRGVVKAIYPAQRELVIRRLDRNEKFVLAENCGVLLYDQKNGQLANILPGDHVTVVYESPSGPDVVRQIAVTSISFTGSITAIDLPDRTVSLDGAFGTKQFSLASDCSIVMKGKTDAPMMDLHPGQRLQINYDEVNGVNVANRIAPAGKERESTTAQATP